MGKGGGGGLAFLNKKSWHTGGMKQIEEVWKREAQLEQETKKIQELQKQMNEERKQEEMLGVASSAGHISKSERLEFMYRGVPQAKEATPQTGDETMNKPFEMKENDKNMKLMETKQTPGALFLDDTTKSQNEQWARLNNDPMLMIKQMEMERLKHVKNNPVKMAQIKKEVEEMRAKNKAKKDAKKDAKKAKKEAKKSKKEGKHRKASSSDSDSSPSPPRSRPTADADLPPPPPRHRPAADAGLPPPPPRPPQIPSDSQQHRDRRGSRSPPKPPHSSADRNGNGAGYAERSRSPSKRDRSPQRRHRSPPRRDRSPPRGGRSPPRGDRSHPKRDRSPPRRDQSSARRHSSPPRRERSPLRRDNRDRSPPRRDRSPARRDSSPARRKTSPARQTEEKKKKKKKKEEEEEEEALEKKKDDNDDKKKQEVQVHYGGGCAQKTGTAYGLDMSHMSEDLRLAKTERAARLEEERRNAPKEEAKVEGPVAPRQKHRAGRVSAEEAAARLAAMQSDAGAHEEARMQRLLVAKRKDDLEDAQQADATLKDGATFLENASKTMYGTDKAKSLEETVNRRSWYREGRGGDEKNAFKKFA